MVNVTEIQKNFQSPNANYMVKLTKNKKNQSPDGSVYGKNYQKISLFTMIKLIWSHFMKILTKNISHFTNTDIYVQNKSQKSV